jgi:hypothetical protein
LSNLAWRFSDRLMWATKEDKKASRLCAKCSGGGIVHLADRVGINSHANVSVRQRYRNKPSLTPADVNLASKSDSDSRE